MKHLIKSQIGKTLTRIMQKTDEGFDEKELTKIASELITSWKESAKR